MAGPALLPPTTNTKERNCYVRPTTISRRGFSSASAAIAGLSLSACAADRKVARADEAAKQAAALASADDSAAAEGTSAPIATTTDIPVGGALILVDEQLVVAQPTAGTFLAFSAVCPHQGCIIDKVDKAAVVCPCHKAAFSLADGTNTVGPGGAAADLPALAAVPVAVTGSDIFPA